MISTTEKSELSFEALAGNLVMNRLDDDTTGCDNFDPMLLDSLSIFIFFESLSC